MKYYLCIKDIYADSGERWFSQGKFYTSNDLSEYSGFCGIFLNDLGEPHLITPNWLEYFREATLCNYVLADEYLEDKYLEEAYKKKKSNKLNKEMEELKITKEKVLAASKLGSKEEEVLKTLFPEVFEDGYFKFGTKIEISTSSNHNPLLIGWGLVDEEHSGRILLVNRAYEIEVLNNVGAGNYVGLKFKKKEQ